MQLADFFTQLSYGVLTNTVYGGSGSGIIPNIHAPRLVSLINQCLLALYGRFPLEEKEIIVRAYTGMTIYPLKKIYADSDATIVAQKFITDSSLDPFTGDILKILAVFDEEGNEVPLNETLEESSLFTPSTDTLQIPYAFDGDAYYVVYQARHAPLVNGDTTQEIALPEILVQALEAYVAYKIYSSMNGAEATGKSQEHLARYDMICREVEDRDLVNSSTIDSTDKMKERGFA